MAKPDSFKFINIPKDLNSESVLEVVDMLNDFAVSNERKMLINFSETSAATPSGLTPLLCYLRDLPRIKKFHGIIVHSNNAELDGTITRMGFYNHLGLKDDFGRSEEEIELAKELYCFNTTTPEKDIIDVNEKIIYSFTSTSKKENFKKAVSWCIPEIVDNARTHSMSPECVLYAQNHKHGRFTEFCVADRGLGIQETMGDKDIVNALLRCITQEKGVNSEGMGNGLHYTSELIKNDKSENQSYLRILSGDAMLEIKSGKKTRITQYAPYWKGTVVTLGLSDNIKSSIEDIKGSEVDLPEDLPNFYL